MASPTLLWPRGIHFDTRAKPHFLHIRAFFSPVRGEYPLKMHHPKESRELVVWTAAKRRVFWIIHQCSNLEIIWHLLLTPHHLVLPSLPHCSSKRDLFSRHLFPDLKKKSWKKYTHKLDNCLDYYMNGWNWQLHPILFPSNDLSRKSSISPSQFFFFQKSNQACNFINAFSEHPKLPQSPIIYKEPRIHLTHIKCF